MSKGLFVNNGTFTDITVILKKLFVYFKSLFKHIEKYSKELLWFQKIWKDLGYLTKYM